MQIHQLSSQKKNKKRIGRGGKRGTYSGKGMKGQKARSGYSRRATWEGGRTTLVAKTKKKKGFKSVRPKNQVLSLAILEAKFAAGDLVSPEKLLAKKLIRNLATPVKILGQGTLTKKLVFQEVLFSETARQKIEKAGGKIEK